MLAYAVHWSGPVCPVRVIGMAAGNDGFLHVGIRFVKVAIYKSRFPRDVAQIDNSVKPNRMAMIVVRTKHFFDGTLHARESGRPEVVAADDSAGANLG